MIHYRTLRRFRIPRHFREPTAQAEKKPKDNSTILLILIRISLHPQKLYVKQVMALELMQGLPALPGKGGAVLLL